MNHSDLMLIKGNMLTYYDCREVDPKVALDLIKTKKLVKYSKTLYAKVDNDDITYILSLRKPSCKLATTIKNFQSLNEELRSQIISLSKKTNFARYYRRKTIDISEVTYKSIDVEKFVNEGRLIFYMHVRSYDVTIEINGITKYLKKNLNGERSTFKKIRKYISKAIDDNDIRIDCTCPDFRYRFAYTATVNGYKANDPETRPSLIRNPDLKGSSCKHIMNVLSNKKWIVKYVSLINALLIVKPEILDL